MKTIAKSGKLQLHKETLRLLSSDELQAVNGASAALCEESLFCATRIACDTIVNTVGTISIPNGRSGCGIILPHGAFDPIP